MTRGLTAGGLAAWALVLGAGEAVGQVQVLAIPSHPVHGQLYPRRISGDGNVVVGFGRVPTTVALVWDIAAGTVEVVPSGSPAGSSHTASDVSYDGSAVAGTCHGPSGQTGFIWRRGVGVELLNGQAGQPRIMSGNTISGDGLVVGGDTPSGTDRAAIWSSVLGTLVLPGTAETGGTRHVEQLSHDGRTAAGILRGSLAFVWREGEGCFLVPPPAGLSNAYKLSLTSIGDAVYGMSGGVNPGTSVPFTWNPDTGTAVIPDLPDYELTIEAANDDGRLVVGRGRPWVAGNPNAAIIHTYGVGTVTLAEYLGYYGASYEPADFGKGMGISDAGNVIMEEGGLHPYWVAILPPLAVSDFNADTFTDFQDLDAYYDCFEGLGPLPVSSADLNRDGITDFFDLIEFMDHFGG